MRLLLVAGNIAVFEYSYKPLVAYMKQTHLHSKIMGVPENMGFYDWDLIVHLVEIFKYEQFCREPHERRACIFHFCALTARWCCQTARG
jgi:hypothetical protein